jgi:hypothetical protein
LTYIFSKMKINTPSTIIFTIETIDNTSELDSI